MTAKTKKAHVLKSKRCAQVLAVFCTCHSLFFAQAGGQQTVSPREIFTGDRVCISFSFESDVDFFALANPELFYQDSLPHTSGDRLDFAFLNEEILENPSDALVQECSLKKTRKGWTFSVVMTPWQTGEIRFKAIDLQQLCTSGKSSGFQVESGEILVALEPVEVLSVSKKLGETSLRGVKEPPLLARTRRTLLFLTISAILVVAAILLLCRHKITRALKMLIASAAYKRNAHLTKKHLSRLAKSTLSDRAICENWMQTMRSYLSLRFSCDFTHTAPSDISQEIFDATGGLLEGTREQAAEDLALLFSRANYIASSRRVGEGRRFSSGEKETFLSRTLKVIDTFEFLGDEDESTAGKNEEA